MSDVRGRRSIVSVGKVLAAVLVVGYFADAVGLAAVSAHLGRDTLVAFGIFSVYALASLGLLAAVGSVTTGSNSRHRTTATLGRLPSAFGIALERLLTGVTLLVVFAAGVLFVTAQVDRWIEPPASVDLGRLGYLTVGLVVLTLVVRDDGATATVARAGALVAIGVVGLSTFSSTLQEAMTVEAYALAALLVAVVLWKHPGERATTDRELTALDGRAFPLLLAAVTALGAVAVTYRLGALHLQGDEYLVADTAASYYFTGELYRWNWIADEHASRYYDRAWPHTLLVAGSYAIFGVSEWSARIVSAAFGILAVPITYVVVTYFTERRIVAIVTSLALAVYPGFVFYFRWARMYALLIPLFLVLTYLVYRSMTESNPIDFRNRRLNETVDRHADFNYAVGLVTIPVLYVAYQIHYNALVVLAAAFVYVVYRAIATGERKYYTATGLGLAGILVVAIVASQTAYFGFLDQFLSFFDRENTVYHSYLFRYPFEWTFGFALAVAGLAIPARLENRGLTHKLVFLYILCAFALVFYVYVGDRYASFAYIVHVVPFGIALVVFAYVSFLDTLRIPVLRYALILLLVVSLAYPMVGGGDGNDYRSLYYEDSEDFDTAYGTIVTEFEEDEDVLIAQYARDFYLRDLPEDAEWISMRNNQDYGPDEFHEDIERHESGWITWESGKAYHVHPEVRAYIDEHFEQHHGVAVDDTSVEVYYFDEDMID